MFRRVANDCRAYARQRSRRASARSGFHFPLIVVVCLLAGCPGRAQSAPAGLQEHAPQASPSLAAKALAQICPPSAILRDAGGKVTGCNTCPPGTSGVIMGDHYRWALSGATVGHFTSARASNILLEGGGACEPHSDNYGGTYVFALHSGSPKLLRYNPGLSTSPCRQLLLQDGRNFLVCEDENDGQGYRDLYIYSAVFNAKGKGRQTFLFWTEDNLGACGDWLAHGEKPVPLQASRILSVRFPDLNGDGRPDLSITASLGKKAVTVAMWNSCGETNGYEPTDASTPQKRYTINYLFDGSAFHPTPAAQKILKLFGKLPPPR
jgi:hypothetical protein